MDEQKALEREIELEAQGYAEFRYQEQVNKFMEYLYANRDVLCKLIDKGVE